MKKATYLDLYSALSFQAYRTAIELREQLENKGLEAGHMRGFMHKYMRDWESQNLIASRERSPSQEMIEISRKFDVVAVPMTEYLRISSDTPKLFETEKDDGLEDCLQPAPA